MGERGRGIGTTDRIQMLIMDEPIFPGIPFRHNDPVKVVGAH